MLLAHLHKLVGLQELVFDEQTDISCRVGDILRQLLKMVPGSGGSFPVSGSGAGGFGGCRGGGGGGSGSARVSARVGARIARLMKRGIPRFLRLIDDRTPDAETYG